MTIVSLDVYDFFFLRYFIRLTVYMHTAAVLYSYQQISTQVKCDNISLELMLTVLMLHVQGSTKKIFTLLRSRKLLLFAFYIILLLNRVN